MKKNLRVHKYIHKIQCQIVYNQCTTPDGVGFLEGNILFLPMYCPYRAVAIFNWRA